MGLVTRIKDFVLTTAADFKTLVQAIGNKVDKVNGKALSTEDYSTADKGRVATLGDLGGQNLLFNSAMRVSTVAGIADGWKLDAPATPGASTGSLSLLASFVSQDENAQRLTVAGLNTTTLYRSLTNDPLYPTPKVSEGMKVTVSTYVKGTAGLMVIPYAQALNSAGTALGAVPGTLTALDGNAQRIAVSYPNLPVGTVRIQTFYRVYAGPSVTGGTVDIARPQLQIGELSAWSEDTRTSGKIPQYTLATRPVASGNSGVEIDVIDAPGGPQRQRSNGLNWMPLNAGAWTNLTMTSGFTSSTTHPAQYRIVDDAVELRGKVILGSMSAAGTLYPFTTLPTGCRPQGLTSDTEVLRIPIVCVSSIGTGCHLAANRLGVCSVVVSGLLSLSTLTFDITGVRFSTLA